MRGFSILALLVLAAATLSGCAGAPKPTTPPDSGVDCTNAKNSQDPLCLHSTTGSIRGVVTDAAIHPLAGVAVSVKVPGKAAMVANTTATGAFGFGGLAPGTYFVQASKVGFSSAQTSADVVAGQVPPVTKILLQADMSSTPYFTAYALQGYMECSGATFVISGAYCSIPSSECGQAPGAPCNVTQDKFGAFYTLDKVPNWVQSEMVWQSTQAASDQMDLDHSYGCGGTFYCDYSATGGSPLVLHNNATEIRHAGWGSNGTQLFVRAFTGPIAGSAVCDPSGTLGCTYGLGESVEQSFTIYTHVFYGFQPPDGWSFGKDGDPPLPK
ncbi:MAG: carboxypeptidase-like regulatory domain-containing protein [Thermoplasmatota archaeon]